MEGSTHKREEDSSENEEKHAEKEEKYSNKEGYEIHIGKTLRKVMQRKGISTIELGKMIGRDDSAVSKMLRKPYLHSKVMIDISSALGHDLFQYLYQPGEWPANKALKQQVQELEKENETLKKENELLKEVNALLKKK